MLVFAYWLTFNILKSRKPKFQQLDEASDPPPADALPAIMAPGSCNIQCSCCRVCVSRRPVCVCDGLLSIVMCHLYVVICQTMMSTLRSDGGHLRAGSSGQ